MAHQEEEAVFPVVTASENTGVNNKKRKMATLLFLRLGEPKHGRENSSRSALPFL